MRSRLHPASLVLATGAMLAACDSRLPTEPGDVALASGFRAHAESNVVAGIRDNVLLVRVIVENVSGHTASLPVETCTVFLRVARVGAAQPSYDESGNGCIAIITPPITLAAGRADTLWRSVDASHVVAAGAVTARYRVEALVAAGSYGYTSRLALDAGEVELSPCCTSPAQARMGAP